MANTIQIRRGTTIATALAAGELALNTVSPYDVYIGTAGGNKKVGSGSFLPLAGGTMTGAIAMSTYKLTGVGDPTADQDVATKKYVDGIASGISAKPSVRLATAAVLAACTAAGSGPTHTLTGNSVGILAVDGINTVLYDRILVKNQAAAKDNGIYSVTTEGTAGVAFVLTRVSDLDTWAELISAFVWVQVGTQADTGWVCTIDAGGALESTDVTWVQFNASASIGDGTVTFAKMANLAANTIIGRVTQSTGVPQACSASDVKTILGIDGHTQGTDTGTTSATFQLLSGASGPKLLGTATDISAKNAANNAFVNLITNGLQIFNATYKATLTFVGTAADRALVLPDVAGTLLCDASIIDGGTW